MAFHQVNDKVHIKQASASKGLGLFASTNLSKGLRIMSETPVLVYESRHHAIENIAFDLEQVPDDEKSLLIRLYAGITDIVPFLEGGEVRNAQAVSTPRLRNIAKYNAVERQGIGCFLAIVASTINHDCVPNSFLCYNDTTEAVNLHALREIHQDEEITISYFQELVFLNKQERADLLGNWQFTCHCDACSSEEPGSNRMELKRLCQELIEIHSTQIPSRGRALTVIGKLREVVVRLEEERLLGPELWGCRLQLANLFYEIGDGPSQVAQLRIATQLLILCLGTDHPSSQALVALAYE